MDIQSVVLDLQAAVDHAGFANIGKKTCTQTVDDDGMPELCPHLAVLIVGGVTVCSEKKSHVDPKKQSRYCFLHALQMQSAAPSSAPLLDLMQPVEESPSAVHAAVSHLFAVDADARRKLFAAARSRDKSDAHDHHGEETPEQQWNAAINAPAGTEYDFTPDPARETHCVCGWKINSPMERSFHDRRHQTYERERAEAIVSADAPPFDDQPAAPMLDEAPEKPKKRRAKAAAPAPTPPAPAKRTARKKADPPAPADELAKKRASKRVKKNDEVA